MLSNMGHSLFGIFPISFFYMLGGHNKMLPMFEMLKYALNNKEYVVG